MPLPRALALAAWQPEHSTGRPPLGGQPTLPVALAVALLLLLVLVLLVVLLVPPYTEVLVMGSHWHPATHSHTQTTTSDITTTGNG